MAEDEDKDDDRDVCDEAFGERDLEDGAAARKLAGAIVLADERRAGLAEGVQEVVDDRLDRDAGARCCHDSGAETVDGRLDHDVRKREDGSLDACRKADAHDLGSRAAVPVELRRLHPDGRVDFQEPHKQDECTRKIAEIGCKRRSHNKPAEDADEEVAEGHIEKGCDSKGLERQTGDAHRAEDGRFEIVEQDGRKREEIDTQEQHCLAKCLFRHKQEPEQRLCGNLSDDGHSNAHKGHEHGGMHGLRDRILVAPADSSGNRHVGAKGNADKEANQKPRDWRVRADGSHAEGAHIAREPANHHRVNQVRELLQDACGCNRKGKTQDRCPEIAMKDINRLCRSPRSCHRILSLNMHAPPLPHPVQSTARAGWRYGNGMSPLSSSCRRTYGRGLLSIKRASCR